MRLTPCRTIIAFLDPADADAVFQNTETNNKAENVKCDSRLAMTPINVNCLKRLLTSYNKKEAIYLLNGFKFGFSLHYEGPRKARMSQNLKSALANPTLVREKIHKEIAAGRMAGPFNIKPFKHFIVSPVGLVPKKTPGDFRLIHHLSFPEGESINDGIARKYSSVHYTSFDAWWT